MLVVSHLLYGALAEKKEGALYGVTVPPLLLGSTIAYLLTVITTHYIPDITPSEYHAKRKDVLKEELSTLIVAETCYNKMIGNPSKRVQLTPVLPNLVTSTDKVTIFASQSMIESKDSYYVESKPTS